MRIGLNLPPQIKIFGTFFVYALALGAIYPRIGDLQLALGLTEGQLGLALIGAGAGTFFVLTFGGRVVDKIGNRRVTLGGILLLPIAMAIATLASNAAMLFALLFIAGLLIGAIEIVINVEADRVEHQIGRRIMSRCHAFWSFGFFSAGLVGVLAKQIGLSPQAHLFMLVPFVVVLALLFIGQFKPAAARSSEITTDNKPHFNLPSGGILALVAFTLSALFLEGANADWSVIYMRDTFSLPPAVNAFAFSVGAFTMAITRFFADDLVERFGPVGVANALISTLGIGALLVATAFHPIMAMLGFALIGVGASALFPLAMSAAAQRTDRPAAVNVAALAQTSFVAFLVGPPLLGFVAQHFGLRMSFAICLPLVVVSFIATRALKPADKRGQTRG